MVLKIRPYLKFSQNPGERYKFSENNTRSHLLRLTLSTFEREDGYVEECQHGFDSSWLFVVGTDFNLRYLWWRCGRENALQPSCRHRRIVGSLRKWIYDISHNIFRMFLGVNILLLLKVY